MKSAVKFRVFIAALVILTLILAGASLVIGRYETSLKDFNTAIAVILGQSNVQDSVIVNLRLPRIIAALFVGAALALSGATFQAVLKNPLASPDILGTSSAAAFGAAIGLLFFPKHFAPMAILSFIVGFLSVLALFGICKLRKANDVLTVILSGIIIGSLFQAFTSIIKYVADPEETLPAITYWLMGSFSSVEGKDLLYLLPIMIICMVVLYLLRWKMNILSLGDDEAKLSGVNPQLLRFSLLAITAILVSLSVAVSGVVGWVGLVIPHLVRTLVGFNHGKVIPTCAIIGALFVLAIDDIARSVLPVEIPIGILTSLIGAPLFAFLFITRGINDSR